MSLSRHQAKINEVTERVRERQNLGRYAASGSSDSLAKSPPFTP
jgi:hypothetical protein